MKYLPSYLKVGSMLLALMLVACSDAAQQANNNDTLGLDQEVATKPVHGDIDVPITTSIQITFNELTPGLSENDFQLCPVINGVLQCNDAVNFILEVQDAHHYFLKNLQTQNNALGLDPATEYELILFNNDPLKKRNFLFSTTMPPRVDTTNPFDTANGAVLAGPISAQFSEAINPDLITQDTMIVNGPNGRLDGVVTLLNGSELLFTSNQPLNFNEPYQVEIQKTDILDLAGNRLENTFLWQFNSGHRIDSFNNHTCARFVNGQIKCWGLNFNGPLGLGDTNNRGDDTTEMGANLAFVPLGTDASGTDLKVVQLAVGSEHTCARFANGEVKCWGYNGQGQLGQGDQQNRGGLSAPDPSNPNISIIVDMGDDLLPIELGTDNTTGEPLKAIDIVAGFYHNCARFQNKRIKCWGHNTVGQLGLGDTDTRGDGPNEMGDHLSFVDLGTGSNNKPIKIAALKAGQSHNCARIEDDRVKCWGNNFYGQLGLGDTNFRGDEKGPNNENIELGNALPFISFGTDSTGIELLPVEISTGGNHTCARFADGRIKCWGLGNFGQLGLGDQLTRGDEISEIGNNLPFVPLGSPPEKIQVTEISAGGRETCAKFITGRIKCWGNNFFGQLGLGDVNHRGDAGGVTEMGNNLPFVPLGQRSAVDFKVTELTSGFGHQCAVLNTGGIKCWGTNGSGQLGLGDTAFRGDNGGIIDTATTEMGDTLLFIPLE